MRVPDADAEDVEVDVEIDAPEEELVGEAIGVEELEGVPWEHAPDTTAQTTNARPASVRRRGPDSTRSRCFRS